MGKERKKKMPRKLQNASLQGVAAKSRCLTGVMRSSFHGSTEKKRKKLLITMYPFFLYIYVLVVLVNCYLPYPIYFLLSTFNPTPKFPFNGGGQFNNLGGDGFSSHFEAHWKSPSYSLRHYIVYKKPRCVHILSISSNTELDSLGSSDIAAI